VRSGTKSLHLGEEDELAQPLDKQQRLVRSLELDLVAGRLLRSGDLLAAGDELDERSERGLEDASLARCLELEFDLANVLGASRYEDASPNVDWHQATRGLRATNPHDAGGVCAPAGLRDPSRADSPRVVPAETPGSSERQPSTASRRPHDAAPGDLPHLPRGADDYCQKP
jgi:hypothetical protein